MMHSPKKSILLQLILAIAGASIISAMVASLGQYLFTSSLISQSAQSQVKNALLFSKELIDYEHSRLFTHDLTLIKHNKQLFNLQLTDRVTRSSKYLTAEKIGREFIKLNNKSYEGLYLLNSNKDILLSVENDTESSFSSGNEDKIDYKHLTIFEIFNEFQRSKKTGIRFFGPTFHESEPYFFAATQVLSTTENKDEKTVIIRFNIHHLIEHLKNIKILDYPAVSLFSHKGEILYSAKSSQELTAIHEFLFNGATKPTKYIFSSSTYSNQGSMDSLIKIVVSFPETIINRLLIKSILTSLFILLAITITVAIIAYLVAKKITLPIIGLTKLSQKVAAGDFTVRMPSKGHDEISILGQAFNIMIQELDEQRYELKSLANKDTLTQLPNRRQFEEHLGILIKSSLRNKQSIAVMYIDLDQFKDTNDSFGHPAGDKLIKDVSSRLLKTVRQSDLVARLGGDEFAIILNPHKSMKDTEFVAKKILQELGKPFNIENQQIFSGGSIGISVFPDHGKDSTELVKNADAAMYKAKNSGRNNYQFYSDNLTTHANERVVLGALIRNAVINDQFSLYYQPKINIHNKQIVGAEALLRWEHKGQLILPAKIINIAESAGFIEKIDAWVINSACQQIKQWLTKEIPIVPISINISGRLLEKDKAINLLKKALHHYSLDPQWIEIEITENDLISNPKETQKALKVIHSLGVKVAIDDFGTGYSSLSYLKDLLADTLKIDRKFVVNAMQNHADKEIVSAIVRLARSLNLHVVVEGIETEEQEMFFKELGAHSAQGYLYAKAMNPEVFISHLEKSRNILPKLQENYTIAGSHR